MMLVTYMNLKYLFHLAKEMTVDNVGKVYHVSVWET